MRRKVLVCISIVLFFSVWHVISVFMAAPLVLPEPADVFLRITELLPQKTFQLAIFSTLGRAVKAFAVSVCFSLILGILIGANENLAALFRFPLSVIKATPVVSIILVAMFWFKSAAVPVFVSVLMTLPVLTETVAAGIRSTDKKLLAMSEVYCFSFWQKLRFIYVPSVLPYFFSGMLSALGLTWKVVVAGEILSLPKNSVGMALQTAKVHLETVDVFAWTVTVVALSYAFELFFNWYIKKIRSRFQPESADGTPETAGAANG